LLDRDFSELFVIKKLFCAQCDRKINEEVSSHLGIEIELKCSAI
jgi:hypothetical protein